MRRTNLTRGRLRLAAIAASVLVTVLLAGCGYSIRPPYSASIKTVYVPVFKSISFRRDLNEQLTLMVQQEISKRTGFHVVGKPEGADTRFEGIVVYVDKNVMVESPNNLPRQLIGTVSVDVRWIDLRNPDPKEQDKAPVRVIENMPFFPELGETTLLGYQRILQKLAYDIVNMMEMPWGSPND